MGTLKYQNNRLVLTGSFSSPPNLRLSSLRGQVLYNGPAVPEQIHSLTLNNGVYLWQITSGTGSVSGKLVRK